MPRVPGVRVGWCSRLGGGGSANKQMSIMPNVAVGWFSSLLGTVGTPWGGKLNIWEGIIYCQPIWDVFVPQWGQGRAGEETTMRFRSPSFQIRQAVPGGLARAWFCCWACWAWFFLGKKLYYINYNTFTCIPVVFVSRGLGMGGWNSKSLDDVPN